MNIRRLKKNEIEKSIEMSEYAFQFELSNEERTEEREKTRPEESWVMVDDHDAILSRVMVLPLSVYFNQERVKMAGIAGVATWPESRNKGHVRDLLKHTLYEAKKEGYILSFLYPASIPFYRQFGWELFADTSEIEVTCEQLPSKKGGAGNVERLSLKEEETLNLIDPLYHTWAKGYAGTLVRDKEWWQTSIYKRKNGIVALYRDKNQLPQGYIIYKIKNNKMKVDEFVSITKDAKEGLWSYISRHDSMIDSVTLHSSTHENDHFILPDPKIKRTLTSYFMARIVDVKAFLRTYPFSRNLKEDLTLHVEDSFCEWNSGTYLLKTNKSEETIVEHRSDSTSENREESGHGIHLSTNALCTLFFGYQSFDFLVREGYIEGDDQSLVQLKEVIVEQKPFIYDFF